MSFSAQVYLYIRFNECCQAGLENMLKAELLQTLGLSEAHQCAAEKCHDLRVMLSNSKFAIATAIAGLHERVRLCFRGSQRPSVPFLISFANVIQWF